MFDIVYMKIEEKEELMWSDGGGEVQMMVD